MYNIPNFSSSYFLSQDNKNELSELNTTGYQRNSGFIFNKFDNYSFINENNQNQEDLRNTSNNYNNNSYVKYTGPSSLNKTPNFRKINNLYENNYKQKHINANSKSDLSKTSKIPTDKNYRNTAANNNGYLQNKKYLEKFLSKGNTKPNPIDNNSLFEKTKKLLESKKLRNMKKELNNRNKQNNENKILYSLKKNLREKNDIYKYDMIKPRLKMWKP